MSETKQQSKHTAPLPCGGAGGGSLYYKIFHELNNIPRPSHHEEKVADYLCAFADKHGLTWRRDKQNCVVIEKPASPGYESHEPVVILNHMDMVCVAEPGKKFNPLTDGIEAIIVDSKNHQLDGSSPLMPQSKCPWDRSREGAWMRANRTSLGADNGIGLSMALAILADDTLPHPALEVLTTTNEEDGMSGASQLAADFIHGRRVLNLDSEAYDEITIGAAGALIQTARLPFHKIQMPQGYVTYDVTVTGGLGGHSGVDINKGRANAIKVLANLLLVAIRQCDIKLYLVNFEGGNAAASIPGNAHAKVIVPQDKTEQFDMLVTQCDEALEAEFSETDPNIQVDSVPAVWHGAVVSEEGTHLLLACINGIPVGPTEMLDDSETPMTSNNIGLVTMQSATATTHHPSTNAKPSTALAALSPWGRAGREAITPNTFIISTHTRSFDDKKMENLADQIRRIFEVSGAEVQLVMNAPAWKEDESNSLVSLTCDTFKDVLGFEPKKVSMHFVLEAGYLVKTFPGLHIASIGPRILEPHSTHERVELSTVDNIWKVAIEILKRL